MASDWLTLIVIGLLVVLVFRRSASVTLMNVRWTAAVTADKRCSGGLYLDVGWGCIYRGGAFTLSLHRQF